MRPAHEILELGNKIVRSGTKKNAWQKAIFITELVLGALMIAILCSIALQSCETQSDQAQATEGEPVNAQVSSAEIADVPDQVENTDTDKKASDTDNQGTETCEHLWTAITHTVDHPQLIHEITHNPEYETQSLLHTVCNECKEIIDGKAQEHLEQTGHTGFTTSVPIDEETLVSEAWTETIVDEEAWTETVVDGYVCSLCKTKIEAQA